MLTGWISRSLAIGAVAAAALSTTGSAFAQEAPAAKPAAPAQPKAAEATLKVGDPAPALTIETWVKGEEVKSFETGKTYVVEFWATWCGPCIASMPHLSEIQKEYKSKGLTVIGVTSEDKNNTLEKVQKMVSDKGDTMGYTVAWDKGRTTNGAFMKAAARNGIPCSFVVDGKGNIAYIGHPMTLDLVLDQVVAGTWDYKTGPEGIAKMQSAQREIGMKARTDPKAALEAFATFEKEYPKVAEGMTDLKYQLLLKTGDFEGAYKIAGKLVDDAIAKKDSSKLNQIAWNIVDPEANVENKNLDLALKAATKAAEITENKNAAVLDTLARVHFVKGDIAKAIEIQTKAVELAEGDMKKDLEKALDEYNKKGEKHD